MALTRLTIVSRDQARRGSCQLGRGAPKVWQIGLLIPVRHYGNHLTESVASTGEDRGR